MDAAMDAAAARAVLGLPPAGEVGAEDVRRAYKRAALASHPDKPGGSHERFQKVGQAYKVLTEGPGVDFDFAKGMDAAFDLFAEMMDGVLNSGILDELDTMLQNLAKNAAAPPPRENARQRQQKTRRKMGAPAGMGGVAGMPAPTAKARPPSGMGGMPTLSKPRRAAPTPPRASPPPPPPPPHTAEELFARLNLDDEDAFDDALERLVALESSTSDSDSWETASDVSDDAEAAALQAAAAVHSAAKQRRAAAAEARARASWQHRADACE